MNCRFRAAAEGNIRLAAADHPRCIADGLGTRCAGGDRRADGAPEAVGDRHMPGGQVGQKRGDSERRETTRPAFIGGMYRIGDLAEAAANLFGYLRTLDAKRAHTIAVMPIPNEGLGEAINDRLRRAAVERA